MLAIGSNIPALPAVHRRSSADRVENLYLLTLAALLVSAVCLAFVLDLTKMRLSGEFGRIVLLSITLIALSGYARCRAMHWRVLDAARISAVVVAGLMLCGLVSNVGLRLGMPLADPFLARLDAEMGFDTRRLVSFTIARPLLTAYLHQIYNFSAVLCGTGAVIMLIQGKRLRLWQFIAQTLVAMQITAIISIFFPARGAILYFGAGNLQASGLPAGAGTYAEKAFDHFYTGSQRLVELQDLQGTVTFPSFHTVLALLLVQVCWSHRLKPVALMLSASTIISTIPMGGHYVLDLFGGFGIWAMSYALTAHALRRSVSA